MDEPSVNQILTESGEDQKYLLCQGKPSETFFPLWIESETFI